MDGKDDFMDEAYAGPDAMDTAPDWWICHRSKGALLALMWIDSAW